ncbi:hypothetical protein ACOXXX_03445 [Thalassococcus sp. BH17M4-6]|uniref:hypothetical protein n=1 Tax=Thalassococcus sp. BH17M4-6 TaxID=3413148 RepID=UPI003BCA2394
MHRAVLTAVLAAGLMAPALPATPQAPATADAGEEVVLSLPEMRVAAARAVRAGAFELALGIARAMLVADPEDSYSHFIIAQVFLRNGQPEEARPAARMSYKLAKTPVQKHEAARIAALTAARQDRFFPAQIWMRRALHTAPNPAMKARAAHEFRAVRWAARLRLNVGLSVTPSSNVNGGSSEEINTVDGFPIVGVLSPDAQALSGTVARGDLRLRYRLHRSETSQTNLRTSLQVKRVKLSDDARKKAPNAKGSNYDTTLMEIGLSHTQKLTDSGTYLSGGLFLGRAWFGGDVGYDYGRAETTLTHRSSDATALSFGHVRQQQWNDSGPYSDIRTTGWRAALAQRLGNKDRLTLSLATTKSVSDNTQQTSDTQTIRLDYDMARALGPVRLSGGVVASKQHYPDYRVIFPVPGGREDVTLGAKLDMTFHTLDYAGFVPTVTLSAERGDSNVSRFDTDEFSISVGFQSAF